jgi:two-component system response regulator YesN
MYKYIIVDDEPLIRRGILKKIQTVNFDRKLEFAGDADNGSEGLALVRRVDPDIIITDMRMPEMDGKTFLKILCEQYSHKKVIVISGYSDFEYMKEAISAKVVSYLLKPFNREEIQETIGKAIQLIEAERSAQQQLETTEGEKEEIKINADLQTLGNLILSLHHKEKAPILRSNKLKLLKQAERFILMTVYLEEKIEQAKDISENCIYIPHQHNDHIAFYLLFLSNNETDSRGIALRNAEMISQQISRSSSKTIIGISYAKTQLIQLDKAYEETAAALNARSIMLSSTINFFQGDQAPSNDLVWEHMDELLFFLESGNVSKVKEFTIKLFDHFQGLPTAALSEIKNTCEHIILELRNILYHNFESIGNPSTSTSFSTMLNTCFEVNSLKAYMLQVLPGIAEMLNAHSEYKSDNIIDNIKTYIHKNTNKALNLEKISSLFFINPSYCSYLFKEKTGINFIDYVNDVRVEKAKELLKTTDLKVYKIARNLGFENTKYFFRLFKKLTDHTPEEYRMKYS